jgi:ATP-dependent Lon protease
VARAVALEIARAGDGADPVRVTVADLDKYLGRKRMKASEREIHREPGIAAGLAWTPVGGDVLFIETTRMPGKGRVEITGQLGDVMKESARTGLAWLRSHSSELGVDPDWLETHDVHVHVPQGAVPKDGPSAGVTMVTALASLVTGRAVRSDTAMTGEATLRGRVLPVGGIESKVLAAQRAGYTRIILPKDNEIDLEDVPASVREKVEFVLVSELGEVLAAALEPAAVSSIPNITIASIAAA